MLRTERLSEWMTAPLISVTPHESLDAIAARMIDDAIRHLPVLRSDGRCIGMVTDLAVFARGHWIEGRWVQREPADASVVMEPVRCVAHADDELASALAAMRAASSDHALVLTDAGVAVGIFTEHDVVTVGAQLLPGTARPPLGRPLYTAQVDTTVSEGLSQMLEAQVRHLIVLQGTALAGIVSVRDLVARPGDWPLRRAMPFGLVHRIEADQPLSFAAASMERYRVGALVVVHDGVHVGVVSRADIADALLAFYGAEEETEGYGRR